MASITDIVQQYTEMRQGLKQLKLELELYWPNPEEAKEPIIVEKKDLNKISELDEEELQSVKSASILHQSSISSSSSCSSSARSNISEYEQEGLDIRSIYSNSESTSENTKDTSIQQDTEEVIRGESVLGDDIQVESPIEIDDLSSEHSTRDKKNMEATDEQKNTPIHHDRFMQVMQEFCQSANDRFEELEALYVNVDFKWKDIMQYYGENPKTMKPDEFFQIFAKFIKSWKIAAVEELNYTEGIEREERRKIESEEKRRALSVGEISDSDSHTSEGNDRRIMDNLMEELRSGKGENKMRQRRVRERLRRIKYEEDRLKQEEEKLRPIVEKRKAAPLSVIISRRGSGSSLDSTSDQMPAISAEELLRRLQQENDELQQ